MANNQAKKTTTRSKPMAAGIFNDSKKTFLLLDKKKEEGQYLASVDDIQGVHANADGAALVLRRGGVEVRETLACIVAALEKAGHCVTQVRG